MSGHPNLFDGYEIRDAIGQPGPLWKAVHEGNTTLVRDMLAVDTSDINGADGPHLSTMLCEAVRNKHTAIVLVLLRHRVDPNRVGMHLPGESCAGWKPLHFASEDCHHAISLMLLQYGADVNSQTSAGLTPMHLCVVRKPRTDMRAPMKGQLEVEKEDMLQLLLQEGADISIQDTKGRTALWHAENTHGELFSDYPKRYHLNERVVLMLGGEEVRVAQNREWQLRHEAVCMGLHPRLGHQSGIHGMTPEVLRNVLEEHGPTRPIR
jgi:hypothetical protein